MVHNSHCYFHILLRHNQVYLSCREGFKISNILLHPYDRLTNGGGPSGKNLTVFFQKSKFLKSEESFETPNLCMQHISLSALYAITGRAVFALLAFIYIKSQPPYSLWPPRLKTFI